jgi:hypothetical protein
MGPLQPHGWSGPHFVSGLLLTFHLLGTPRRSRANPCRCARSRRALFTLGGFCEEPHCARSALAGEAEVFGCGDGGDFRFRRHVLWYAARPVAAHVLSHSVGKGNRCLEPAPR